MQLNPEELKARMQKAMHSVDSRAHLGDRARAARRQAAKLPLPTRMDQQFTKVSHMAGRALQAAEGALHKAETMVSKASKRSH